MAESPRSILSWLRRCHGEDLSVPRVLDSIRSVYGVVPLGGCVGGANGATPPATPKNSALTLFSAAKDAVPVLKSSPDEQNAADWTLLLTSVQLPFTGGPQELRKALETLQSEETQDQEVEKGLDVERLRQRFFAARKDFYVVRIELLRVAMNREHPNAQVAQEIVDELLKEGLRDTLLDEMHGRQFYRPPGFTGVGKSEQKARMAWEVQFLEEETLLRDLLLVTLWACRDETTSLDMAVKIAKTVQNWEVRVIDEVITSSTLTSVGVQQLVRKVTHVGVLVALRVLHKTGCVQDPETVQLVTKSFFLTELSEFEAMASPVPGVLLLAWATFLSREYRKMTKDDHNEDKVEELKALLQSIVTAAERLHSFHYLNALLQSLVFGIEDVSSAQRPFLQPRSLHGKTLWALPPVATCASVIESSQLLGSSSAPVYQQVVAEFLDTMLSSLGYVDNLEEMPQLHAMVKFVLPVLSDARVAMRILELDTDAMADNDTSGLNELLIKTRAALPHSLLPCVEMFTALCCNNERTSSPLVLRQVLKYFNLPRAGLEDARITRSVCRPLPPTEYFTELKDERHELQCTRSFAYDDASGRVVVPAGALGTVVHLNDALQVEWLLYDSSEDTNASSLWDYLHLSAVKFATDLQSGSFVDLHRANAHDVAVLTSFFEFIVQLGQQPDGEHVVVDEVLQRWGEARLRRWWLDHHVPSPEIYIPQLLRQQIALPALLSASRENLVSWGLRDRAIREQILENTGGLVGLEMSAITTTRSSSLCVDGGIHLLRLLLGVLDGFMHTSLKDTDEEAMEDVNADFAAQMHLVTASFIALRTLVATRTGVELLTSFSLGGEQERCVDLIVKSAKKLFEIQERGTGEYPVVLAAQDVLMSVVRWLLSREAQALVPSASSEEMSYSRDFSAKERLWFVSATDFAMEVVATHQSWKFATTAYRREVLERCFRLLYVLVLPRKYVHERNDLIPAFETALRQTLSTDMSLLRNLLRSSGAMLPLKDDHRRHWNDSVVDATRSCFALRYKSNFDAPEVDLVSSESLTTTCLRFVALLIANDSNAVDASTARTILLTPIDAVDGPKEHKALTMVTLCGQYLGDSLEQAPGIAYWSLQILQRAAVVLDYDEDQESHRLSSMHSLIALFNGYEALDEVRQVFAQLLDLSSMKHLAVRQGALELLTLCLTHQPAFLAVLLFGEQESSAKAESDAFPFVALLERLLETSEKLLEQASDVFCALLTFLVQVWQGALHERLNLHLKLMTALSMRPTFWSNVTQVLKIHMPLDSVEECGLLATAQGRGELQSLTRLSEAYIGRSSAYGYMARGLILQLVSYEWHTQATKATNHHLVDVLESFRQEGLFSHWLRTFTRLDYSSSQLELYVALIQRACNLKTLPTRLTQELPVGAMSTYIAGLVGSATTLKWQLSAGGEFKQAASRADTQALKLVQWSNLQAAYLHAQLFSLAQWKVFMELCCLQPGNSTSETLCTDKVPTLRPWKRKESMISSPPRSSPQSSTSTSSLPCVSPSTCALSSSRFSGDRTSFGMLRVLANVVAIRVKEHKVQGKVLDYFVMVHLHDLVQLLVSMLHHQLCLVVHKTRDPKLSETRQRLEESSANSTLKLDAKATLELVTVVEDTMSAVHDSMEQRARDAKLVGLGRTGHSSIPRVVVGLEPKVTAASDGLLTSLFTAALLLVRHLSMLRTQSTQELEMASPHLQAKLLGHCMTAITTCSERTLSPRACRSLFQLSWGLFHQVLEHFSSGNAYGPSSAKMHAVNSVQLTPIVKKLEHEQMGISALIRVLIQRFRPSSCSDQVAERQQEACQMVQGLAALVWNPTTSSLCRRLLLQDTSSACASSRLRLMSMLATHLVPLLQSQMERDEAQSKVRGYTPIAHDGIKTDQSTDKEDLERSVAHRMWCYVLDFVSGLIRLQSDDEDHDVDVWDFMSSAESLLLTAVASTTCRHLTNALVIEHIALLGLLNALSTSALRRKRWRHAFPTSAVVLMEQSRQLLRRACVLLGSSSLAKSRVPRRHKAKHTNAVVSFGAPKSPRSPSAFTCVHQTLLQEHLQAVLSHESQSLAAFYDDMKLKLVEIVRATSLLLIKWTASWTDRDVVLVVDGVRRVDDDVLVPLLSFLPPSEALAMNSSPSVGHLSLAMDFSLDQLLHDHEGVHTAATHLMLTSAINASVVLFLKTYRLYSHRYQVIARDQDELKQVFTQFHARVNDGINVCQGVDMQLLQHMTKVLNA